MLIRKALLAVSLAIVATTGWVHAQGGSSTGQMADVPPISGEINPGGSPGTRAATRDDADASTRAARCGDGFCTAGETAATCPVDCPGAYGSCGPAAGTTVNALPTGTDACGSGNQNVSDGLGNDGSFNWFCQGALASSPECSALRIIPPACGSANGTGVLAYPTGSPACAVGTQIDRDATGADGQYNWDCRGINTAATVPCSATNNSLPPVCRTYPGQHPAQPASDNASGCSRGQYADINDTSTRWRWTCTNPFTSASSTCTATKTPPANCPSSAVTWTVTGETCSGTFPATNHNVSSPVTNTASGLSGAAQFLCTDGTASFQSGTCSRVPPTVSVVANPTTALTGSTTTLTWTVSNATSCSASGNWSGNRNSSGGTQTVNVGNAQTTRTYTLTCENGAGGPTSSASASVTVVAPPTVTLSVSPASVTTNQSATVSWSTTNATSCTATGGWSGSKATGSGRSQAISFATAGTRTLTLTCENGAGGPSATDSATLQVTAAPAAPTVSLSASPTSVTVNGSTTLTWTVSNATSCTAANAWSGARSTSGGSVVQGVGPAAGTRRYSLTCENGAGGPTASDSVDVTVLPPTPTVTLAASSTSLNVGDPVTLSWSSTNATRCVASAQWSGNKATVGSQGNVTPTNTAPGNRTYRLTCYNGPADTDPSNSDAVVVSYASVPAPTVDIVADPETVAASASYAVRWTTTNATACTASADWVGAKPAFGEQFFTMTFFAQQRVYTLTCENGPGGPTASDTAIVNLTVPTVTLSVSPLEIRTGDQATVSWTSANADTCTASGAWSGDKAAPGGHSQAVGPYATAGDRTYTLVCSNAAGSTTRSASLSVVTNLLPTVDVSANPTTIYPGESSRITWSSTNADSCVKSGYWGSAAAATSGNEFSSPFAAGNYSYTMTCTNVDGSSSDSAIVQVASAPAPAVSLAERDGLYTAQATVDTRYLVWSSSNASNCSLVNSDGTVISNATSRSSPGLAIGPFGTSRVGTPQTFSLVCSNASGTASAERTFTVTSAPAPTPTPTPTPAPSVACGPAHDTNQNSHPGASAACGAFVYTDTADTVDQWRWTCGASGQPTQSCFARKNQCPSGTATWTHNNTGNPPSCSASRSSAFAGQTVRLDDTTGSETGTAHYICGGSGAWELNATQPSPSCTSVDPDPPSAPFGRAFSTTNGRPNNSITMDLSSDGNWYMSTTGSWQGMAPQTSGTWKPSGWPATTYEAKGRCDVATNANGSYSGALTTDSWVSMASGRSISIQATREGDIRLNCTVWMRVGGKPSTEVSNSFTVFVAAFN